MNGTETASSSPELMVWLVLAAIVLLGLLLAQACSYLAWTFQRDNAPMAVRIGWLVAIVAALSAVDWYWYPHYLEADPPNTAWAGEGVGLLLVLAFFYFTYRRRSA